MTQKEKEPEQVVRKTRSRTRRDMMDLRKKVLKDQTCRHLNYSPVAPVREKAPSKPTVARPGKENAENVEPAKDKIDPARLLTCEEKTLKIRRKLERIIHKKETDEGKAMDLLAALMRMQFKPEVLATTKICFTLEALKLVVTSPDVVAKAEQALTSLKKFQSAPPSLNVSNSTEWRDPTAKKPFAKTSKVTMTRGDATKSSTNLLRDIPNRRDVKKREPTIKEQENHSNERQHKERERVTEKDKATEKITPTNDANETALQPAGEPVEGGSGLRIGYWMDRLLNGVDQLSMLDKQVDKIQQNVNSLQTEGGKTAENATEEKSDDAKKASDSKKATETKSAISSDIPKKSDNASKPAVLKKTKSKSDDLFTVTETAKSSKPASSKSAKSMDDDLLNLTADIQKINLKDAKTHDVPLIVSESLKSKDIKPVKDSALLKKDLVKKDKVPQQISQDLSNIRTVLEKHGDHDKSLVMSHLTTLTYMKVTVDLLATSKIGLAVNVMRKQTTDQDLANQAKSLLKSWKKMLQAEPVQVQPPAPKPSTEAEVRAYCTKKLLKALQSNGSLSDSCKLRAEPMAEELEKHIFKLFKETNQKYRNQVNSRYFNLVDNVTLQENLLLGNISPATLAAMSHNDLASDQIKEARARWEEESLKTVPETHVKDDSCTCRICLPAFLH